MRTAVLALAVLSLLAGFAQFAHAADPDNFDYVAFNKLAIKELQQEKQFFSEMMESPKALTTVFGFIPAVTDADVENFQLRAHKDGVDGVLECLFSARSADEVRTIWDGISNADESVFDRCAGDAPTIRKLAFDISQYSGIPVLDLKQSANPDYYNPTLAGLIILYRNRVPANPALYEESIQNALYRAAYQRPRLGEAYLDLGRMKYRYTRQEGVALYVDEDLLSDNDRLGIRVLARCLRQKAPIGLITAYVERGDIPPESYLRSLKCVADAPHGSLDHLQANWAAMGLAIAGHNVMLRSPYPKTPSRAYDIIRATDKHLAEEAVEAIIETDQFVNVHVAGLRQTVKDRVSFKGTATLPLEQRIELAYSLEKRFLIENKDRLDKVEIWKSAAAGADSCVLGEIQGIGTGAVISGAFRLGAAGISKLPGPWKAVGMVALSGVTAGLTYYSVKSTVDQTVHLINAYREIPLNDGIAEACGVASSLIDLAPDSVKLFRSFREQGAKVKLDEQPPIPKAEAPAGAMKVETRVQAETPAQTQATKFVEGIETKEGLETKVEEWTGSDPTVFKPKDPKDKPPSRTVRKKAQKQLQDAGADLPAKVVEEEKPVLDAARQKEKTVEPTEIFTVIQEREALEQGANARVLDAAVPDGRAQLSKVAESTILTYVPKDKSSQSVSARIADKLKSYYESVKGKLKSISRSKTTDSNSLTHTPADYVDGIARSKESSEKLGLFREAFVSPALPANAKQAAVLRKSAAKAYRETLSERQQHTFDALVGELFNTKSMKERPGGFEKALTRYRVLQSGSGAHDLVFGRKLLVSLDPALARFDASGADANLLDDIITFDGTARLTDSTMYSMSLLKAATEGTPMFKDAEIDHLLSVAEAIRGEVPPELAKTMRQRITEMSTKLPATYRDSFNAAAKSQGFDVSLADVSATSLDRIGSGGFRTAYLIQYRFHGNDAPLKYLVKVGGTVEGEKELLAKFAQSGVAPEPYGLFMRLDQDGKPLLEKKGKPSKDSMFYQEFIKGKLLSDLLPTASPAERRQLLIEMAEMDALFATRGSVIDSNGDIRMPFIQDGDKGNVIFLDEPKAGVPNKGRAVQIDLDPRIISLRKPSEWLRFQVFLRYQDFGADDLDAYFGKLHEVFKRELGTDVGDKVFRQMLLDVAQISASNNLRKQRARDIFDFIDATGKETSGMAGREGFYFMLIDPQKLNSASESIAKKAGDYLSVDAGALGDDPGNFDFDSLLSSSVRCTIPQRLANAC